MKPEPAISTHRKRRRLRIAAAILLAAAMTTTAAGPLAAQDQQQAPQQQGIPDSYKLNMMIRTTLIALNHANATGNYTVLQDLSAPAFQRSNNPARLAEIFAKLRKRDLDLSPILFFQPKLQQQPKINENGLLRLTGYFETKPERISFDMMFQPVEGNWRLFGLAVDVARPKAAAQQSGSQAPSQNQQGQAQQEAETRTEPSVERDSAFAPQRVTMPAPSRRPDPPPANDPDQAETATAEDDTSASDTGGSEIWPF